MMLSLALACLRDRALATILNIQLLALAVGTLVILVVFSTQIGTRFERDAAGVDLVVGAKGSPLQVILSSLYQIDAPTGNIPLESLAMLRRDRSVARAIPLALGDSFRGFRIVGTEPAYLDLYQAQLASGRGFAQPGDAVIGAEVARQTGMGLGQQFLGSHGLASDGAGEHDAAPFRAVGILQPTGSVIDRLIVVSLDSVWAAHGIAHSAEQEDHAGADDVAGAGHDDHGDDEAEGADLAEPGHAMQPEITAILVEYRNAFGAVRLPGLINRQTGMQAAAPAVETARLLSLLGSGIEGAQMFAWLLVLTGGLSIFVALLQAASAREGELALLRVMGASPLQVFSTILFEGLIIAAAACMIGLLGGHLLLAAATASFDRLRDIGIDPWAFHVGELYIVAGVLAMGFAASLVPALRIFRRDLAETLAQAR